MPEPTSTETTTETTTEPEAPAAADGAPAGEPQDLDGLRRALASERSLRKQAEQLARQREAAERQLAELQEAEKTELQRLAERAERAERDLEQTRAAALRMEVASAKGLPAALAARLAGSTREEVEADAESLLAEIRANRPTSPPPAAAGVGVTGRPAEGKPDPNELLRAMTGR